MKNDYNNNTLFLSFINELTQLIINALPKLKLKSLLYRLRSYLKRQHVWCEMKRL